ncbi:MAG: hypothetical protein ACPLIG_00825 [Candidatus Bathyarchaeales archaeon]
MKGGDDIAVNLFWTGGWDSTFRLLYLIFVEKRCVQPFYIVDTERSSTLHELRAMHVIKEEVAKRNPQLADLIKPTIIVSVHDIKPDPNITAKFNRLREKFHIGSQYDWLARFAKQLGILNLELSIHKGDHTYDMLSRGIPSLELCIERSERAPNIVVGIISGKKDNGLRIKQFYENDYASIFSFFSFPLFKLSKNDMKRIAAEKGFLDILEKTWFCHKPWRDRPCGICVPCDLTIKEGFGYRVPKISRLRHKVWMTIKHLSNAIKK